MSIKPTKDGRWRARFRNAGRDRVVTFREKVDAEFWLAASARAVARGLALPEPHREVGGATVHDALVRTLETRWRDAADQERQWQRGKRVAAIVGSSRPVSSVTDGDLDLATRELLAQGLAPSTVNRNMSAFAAVLATAERAGMLERRARGRWLREAPGRIRTLSEAEEQAMRPHLAPWAREWFGVLIATGLRCPSELMGLRVRDFDLGRARLEFNGAKGGRVRMIPVTGEALEVLEARAIRVAWAGRAPLFAERYEHFLPAWHAARRAAGLEAERDLTPYCLRHTFASRLCARGVPVTVVQKLMGHASVTQTMVYVHVDEEALVSAIGA